MIICGVRNGDGISDYYKARIQMDIPDVGLVTVVGYITEECAVEFSQNWTSPFESDTVGASNALAKTGAVAQSATDVTSKSLLNSRLVWEGSDPFNFPLRLAFTAHDDAKRQVNDPIRYLAMMQAPELNDKLPGGQIPQLATLDLGRRIKAEVYVKKVSYNAAAPITKDGYMLYNEVTIECSTNGAVNRSAIPTIFR
jgi:hypothetical protein